MKSRNLDNAEVQISLVEQMREYAPEKSLIIGLSGGVDSSAVAEIAAKTGRRVILVEMPIRQDNAEVSRAKRYIEYTKKKYPNVEFYKLDLTGEFDVFEKKILSVVDSTEVGVTLANTRSRLRMTMLYGLAGSTDINGIVVGTGNKVEDYGIGFFTKFGDGGVDISPIGELYKSEVRSLSKHMGQSPEIYKAIATDGLGVNGGSTDEEQIGATYDELEWAMVEYDEGKRAENFTGRAQEVMEIYTARHEGNAHKMKMPPVFKIKV